MPLKERCPECRRFDKFGLKGRKVNEDGDTISETWVCDHCGYEEEIMVED